MNDKPNTIKPIVGPDGRTHVPLGDVVEWLLWGAEHVDERHSLALEVAGEALAQMWLDIAFEREELGL